MKTIYDIATSHFQTADAVWNLYLSNAENKPITDLFSESLMDFNITYKKQKSISINLNQSNSILFNLNQIRPQIGMSLYDIAIGQFGSANEVFELAKANNKSITDIFSHLDSLTIPKIKISKPKQLKYIQQYQIQPNSRIYPNLLRFEVLKIKVESGILNLELSVQNQFPYSISTMLKFDFDQLAVDTNPENQFTDAFDFGIDLPMPDAQFTYDTREISNLGAFQTTTLYIQRAVNSTRTIIVSGIELKNQNPNNPNNIFCTKTTQIKY